MVLPLVRAKLTAEVGPGALSGRGPPRNKDQRKINADSPRQGPAGPWVAAPGEVVRLQGGGLLGACANLVRLLTHPLPSISCANGSSRGQLGDEGHSSTCGQLTSDYRLYLILWWLHKAPGPLHSPGEGEV